MRSRRLIPPILAAAVMAFTALGPAAAPAERLFPLKAAPKHPAASGTARIGQAAIEIRASGLRPNAVYTAWFVNTRPRKHEAGAGQAPFMFRTDAGGNGVYKAKLAEAPFGKWQMLMVVLHPGGDPAEMKGMVPALSAALE